MTYSESLYYPVLYVSFFGIEFGSRFDDQNPFFLKSVGAHGHDPWVMTRNYAYPWPRGACTQLRVSVQISHVTDQILTGLSVCMSYVTMDALRKNK